MNLELIVNYFGELKGKKVLSNTVIKELIKRNVKLKDELDPLLLEENVNFKYVLTGGSTLEGVPMSPLITSTFKKVKLYNPRRGKKTYYANKYVNERTRAISVVVSQKEEKKEKDQKV